MILQKDDIKKVVADYFKDKPVKKVWLFGSYARDEADDESDVDVLVDIEKDSGLGLKYFSWPQELAELLSKNVDVVSEGWENKHIKPFIDKDKMVIYER
jgi:predicted nucleotidyltransferase